MDKDLGKILNASFQEYEQYFVEMDHTEGSVGSNFYEGEMIAYVDYSKHVSIPSINFRPTRSGYGRMIYMDVIDERDYSYADDE